MSPDWRATYRLQLHAGFPLAAAEPLLPYLARLGISHVYLSSCLQARRGSTHGYDVTDPTRIGDDLGGEEAWRSFAARARSEGLGILLDLVPNHMAAGAENPWWDDVLAHGPYSRHASFFDLAMEPKASWHLHLATLAQPYGRTLEAGEFAIDLGGDRPRLVCGGQSWPLCPRSWSLLLEGEAPPPPVFDELDRLPAAARTTEKQRSAYHALAERIDALWRSVPPERRAAAAGRLQQAPEGLHRLIARQYYSLHGWKLAGEIVNYRRFFDVSELVGLRMERKAVFAAVHRRVAAMIAAGEVQGLRVDHPDGLRSPAGYFRRLRTLLPHGRIYAEKILAEDEGLRPGWAVDGTVGYEFLNKVNRLWMSEQKADALTSLYTDFTGHTVNFPEVVREKKAQIIDTAFTTDLERLADLAVALARGSWRTQDLSRRDLRAAIRELTVLLPVYRTYLGSGSPDPVDGELLAGTVATARARAPQLPPEVFDFLLELLTAEDAADDRRDFVARWQQLTPAVTAKGIEDTTFYCYDRLVSCNEVGAQLSLIGISSEQFHQFCHRQGRQWPRSLLATATHDTKRGEDVRARISVLSEDPERWARALRQWASQNLPHWRGRAPDRHAEYLLYQTLVGAWPLERERAIAYMLKACREAKIHTSWHEPNPRYEETIRDFIAALYDSAEFAASLAEFVQPLILPGRLNSLAQTLIKLTAPGVADFYQGTELWDLSLVDPDNRRPVDFALRRERLARAEELSAAEALQDWDSGLPKLWLIARTLALRRRHPAWFAGGAYGPLTAQGSRLGHLLGFVRAERAITLVPRFSLTLNGEWGDTLLRLPLGRWENHFTGDAYEGELTPGALFRAFPVALLVRTTGS